MSTSPAPPRHPSDPSSWRPGRTGLALVLVAVAIGLALSFWAVRRGGQHDFFRAGEVPPVVAEPDYAPLPAPLPADGDSSASGMDNRPVAPPRERPQATERPRTPTAATPGAEPRRPTTAPRPIASRSPPPRYPAQALRRGEGGTVVVRVMVGADGVPTDVSVADSSGSRVLDRAALDAVRRWRFTPATGANGEPLADTVQVPIEFKADR